MPNDVGEYDFIFSVFSDSQDENPDDNFKEISLSITDTVFNAFGSGEKLGSIGTTSFTGAEDGFVMANMYELITTDTLTSVTIGLRTENNLTLPGGEVVVHIYDTTGLSQGNYPIMLYSSDFHLISENDTSNGFKTIGLGDDGFILNSGAYLIGVELYSNANNNPITILDDKTVVRNPWSSCINILGGQWYTNGEAFYISANFGNNSSTPTTACDDLSISGYACHCGAMIVGAEINIYDSKFIS